MLDDSHEVIAMLIGDWSFGHVPHLNLIESAFRDGSPKGDYAILALGQVVDDWNPDDDRHAWAMAATLARYSVLAGGSTRNRALYVAGKLLESRETIHDGDRLDVQTGQLLRLIEQHADFNASQPHRLALSFFLARLTRHLDQGDVSLAIALMNKIYSRHEDSEVLAAGEFCATVDLQVDPIEAVVNRFRVKLEPLLFAQCACRLYLDRQLGKISNFGDSACISVYQNDEPLGLLFPNPFLNSRSDDFFPWFEEPVVDLLRRLLLQDHFSINDTVVASHAHHLQMMRRDEPYATTQILSRYFQRNVLAAGLQALEGLSVYQLELLLAIGKNDQFWCGEKQVNKALEYLGLAESATIRTELLKIRIQGPSDVVG